MNIKTNSIYCGDCLELMKQLPNDSIDCIVTSPPYFGLRDYGVSSQIGQESDPKEYIDKIVEIMKEAKRIIKSSGSIFLNLGDSYFSRKRINAKNINSWLKAKQKLLIPYRIAILCQEEVGLILRNDIHWVKQFVNVKTKESQGNCMPCPSQDRFATNSESIFFFVKDQNYFFNLDAIRIPHRTIERRCNSNSKSKFSSFANGYPINCKYNPKGKNPGDCLRFPFEPSREKHLAMFPSSIPELFIKCGCPKDGIVLDPFMGSGTTALVAKRLNRQFIGFELNPKYCSIINRRLNQNE